MLKPGQKAPAVQLKTLGGELWSLQEELRQHPVLLVFFKISCPTCQFALPFLQRMAQTTAGRIVLVSQDDAEGTRQFHQRFQIDLPTVLDELKKFPVSNAFGISNVPSFFLLAQNGEILSSSHGFVKAEMEKLGETLGIAPFRTGETIPLLRPG